GPVRLGGDAAEAAEAAAANQHLLKNVPAFFAVQVTDTGLSLLFDVMLLSAGFGLLRRQSWARYLSIVYAVLSILSKLGLVIYQITLVSPVTQQLMAQPAEKMKDAAERAEFQKYAEVFRHADVFTYLVMMLYPAIVLIVMLLPSVAAYFREGPDRSSDYDDEYPRRPRGGWGDEDDRPRRWDDDDYGTRRGGWGDDYS